MSEINAGELILELRAETNGLLQDIRNASKQAADQIKSDLQAALNSATTSQNQLNQAKAQARNLDEESLKNTIDLQKAQLKSLEIQEDRLKAADQYNEELAQQIQRQKESVAAAEKELETYRSVEQSRKRINQLGLSANSAGLAGLEAAQRDIISGQQEINKRSQAQLDYEKARNVVLQQSASVYKQIEDTLSRSAEYSKQLRSQTNIETLQTQASRSTTSGLFGGGRVGQAQNNRAQSIQLEEVQLEQRLSEEKKKYLSSINQIVAKGREYISLLEQGGASEAAISQTKEKQKAQVQSLLKDYQQLRSDLKNLSTERIKNIDAEFQKVRSESSRLKFFVREICEGLANQIGGLLTSIVTAPINLAIGLLRSAVSGIIGQISASLSVFKQFESLKVTINIASQGQGAEAFAFLEQAAKKYKIQLDVLADAYKGFVASSLAAGNSLNETNYIFERLIATGRALGLSNEDVKGSIEAVSQMFSKGKIQAEELRGQLGDRFPGAVQIMASAIGVSSQELSKMMEQGQLTSDTLFAFAKKLEDQYGSRLPEALKTTNATAADLQNQIFNLQKDFGEAINPVNQAALEAASEILERISRGAFTQIRQRSEEIRDYLRQNPQIIETISSRISQLLSEGLNRVADKAKEFLEYLKNNPRAIDEGVAKVGQMVELFTKLADLGAKFAQGIVSAAEKMEQFMSIPGVREFFFGSPTIDMSKGAFGLDTGIKTPTGPTSSDSYITGTIPGQQYGDPRGGGRRHAGVDFDISGPDAKAITFAGGIVSRVGNDPGGYGNYVDIYNPLTKMTERIAEMAEVVVKLGQRVAPGQIVGKGESDTGVIHFEVRTDGGPNGAGSGFNGSVNPLDYLRNNNLADVNSGTIKPKQIYGPAPFATGSQSAGAFSSRSSGMLTSLPASKTGAPIAITQNRNVDGYLNRLAFLESTFDTGAYVASTGAAGAFQFTPPTVSDALKAGLPDPSKGSLEEQARAAWLFIKQFHPEAATAIQAGDFNKADRLLKGRWSALPGGGEPQSAERMAQANAFLRGGSANRFSIGASSIRPEDVKPGASAEELYNRQIAELRSYQDQSKKANREAEDARIRTARADRDAAVERAKAYGGGSEASNRFFSRLSDLTKLNDQQSDARKEATRAIEDQEAALKQLKEKPLEFNENQAGRNQAIKSLENLIKSLKDRLARIDKQFAQQIEAKNVEYQRAFEKVQRDFEAEKKQFDLTSSNEYRLAQNELASSSPDLNSYDRQRLELQQANENLNADSEIKKAPLEKVLDELKQERSNLNSAISKLPANLQESARKDPYFQLLESRIQLAQDRIDAVDANNDTRRRINENRAQAIDMSQARAIRSANYSADDELSSQAEQGYRSRLESSGLSDVTITDRVNALSRSNAAAKVRRDLEETIQSLKEAGTWTQELESKLRLTASIKIDNLKGQFKDLASILKDELNSQFKTFFEGLNSGFKSFFQDLITGTKSIGDSFRDLFKNILAQLAQLAINRLFTQLFQGKGIGGLFEPKQQSTGSGVAGLVGSIAGSLFGIPGFADGGVVSRPTLSLIGEGGMNEAVVPLPNGRGIPIDFRGSKSSLGGINSSASITVTVNNNGQASVSSNAAGTLGKQFEEAVNSVLVKQLRPRGLLNP